MIDVHRLMLAMVAGIRQEAKEGEGILAYQQAKAVH